MTMTETKKPTGKAEAPSTKPDGKGEADLVTLDQLAREMKVPPREARMMLRLAAKQKSKFPNLGREHVARQPWSWTPGSKALEEAKKALATVEP